MKENKLIAEFMDYDNVDEMFPFDGELHYHSSWDWLMPVVDKCLSQDDAELEQWGDIYNSLPSCNIDEVYEAVVEFIKQHNNEV